MYATWTQIYLLSFTHTASGEAKLKRGQNYFICCFRRYAQRELFFTLHRNTLCCEPDTADRAPFAINIEEAGKTFHVSRALASVCSQIKKVFSTCQSSFFLEKDNAFTWNAFTLWRVACRRCFSSKHRVSASCLNEMRYLAEEWKENWFGEATSSYVCREALFDCEIVECWGAPGISFG